MVGEIIAIIFCLGIALAAGFAWIDAETKYKVQRKKIYELAYQLDISQRDLKEMQAQIATADTNASKYRRTLAKVSSILANETDSDERDERISQVLIENVPEMLPQEKRPGGGISKRSQQETEEIFHRLKGQWRHA